MEPLAWASLLVGMQIIPSLALHLAVVLGSALVANLASAESAKPEMHDAGRPLAPILLSVEVVPDGTPADGTVLRIDDPKPSRDAGIGIPAQRKSAQMPESTLR